MTRVSLFSVRQRGLKGDFAEGPVCCLADRCLGPWRISAELPRRRRAIMMRRRLYVGS